MSKSESLVKGDSKSSIKNRNSVSNSERNSIKKNKGSPNRGGGNTHKNANMSKGGRPIDRRGDDHRKIIPILGSSTFDLPVKDKGENEKKFTGRCRVFIANLPNDMNEIRLKSLFSNYGEVSEVFLGKGNSFGFIKMDTRKNAEKARDALDYSNYEGRTLRVRLAAHAAAIKVKNLTQMVTNELLEYAFSYFGEVERAIVITDDRGRSIGEGIIEFARKSSAQMALKRCMGECFLLTSIPKPVYVEPFEQRDEEEGFSEKHVNRNQIEYRQEREVGPRFAEGGSFEYEFGMRWKKLFEMEKQKKDRLEAEIQEARQELQNQMEYSKVEHQTKLLREQLRKMEEQTTKLEYLRNDRGDVGRRREEERARQEMMFRQQEEEILRRSQVQDFSSLRREENDLRLQANSLQDMLEREQAMRSMNSGMGPGNGTEAMYGNRAAYATGMGEPGAPPMGVAHPMGPMGHIMNNSAAMEIGYPGGGHPPPPPSMNPAMGGPLGPGAPGGPLGPGMGVGGGPSAQRPSPVAGQQRFSRPPQFNQGPGGQNKRRRF